MRCEKITITAEGQQAGPAVLRTYLLDNIEVAKDRMRPSVIVCAGGGYSMRSDREAEPVVMRFLAMGYHGFLLDYSTAPSRFPTALRELAESVAIVRKHSAEWHADPDKIIVCGFSAAGHLCGSLGVYWNQEFVYGPLGRCKEEVRPDGMILCYPVITNGTYAHEDSFRQLLGESVWDGTDAECLEQKRKVSLEFHVTKDTPKAFIWHTYEDQMVPVENSLLFAAAMRTAGVQFELHIFPEGVHGTSLGNEETTGTWREMLVPAVQKWVELAGTWIEGL